MATGHLTDDVTWPRKWNIISVHFLDLGLFVSRIALLVKIDIKKPCQGQAPRNIWK